MGCGDELTISLWKYAVLDGLKFGAGSFVKVCQLGVLLGKSNGRMEEGSDAHSIVQRFVSHSRPHATVAYDTISLIARSSPTKISSLLYPSP